MQNFDWDKQWVLVCLGVVSIATVGIGATLSVIDFAGFGVDSNDDFGQKLLYGFRAMSLTGAGVAYFAVVLLAERAMFRTDYELAKRGENRRLVVQKVYSSLTLQFILIGILMLLTVMDASDLV